MFGWIVGGTKRTELRGSRREREEKKEGETKLREPRRHTCLMGFRKLETEYFPFPVSCPFSITD